MKKIFTSLLLLASTAYMAQAQLGRPVSFDSVQYVSPQELAKGNDEPAYFGDGRNGSRNTITVEGVVCNMHPGFYGLSASSRKSTMVFNKDGSGRWSGVEVMADPGAVGADNLGALLAATKFYENFIPGLTVKFQGELGNYQGNTQLYLTEDETEVTSLSKTEITPTVMAIDSFKNSAGEDQYVTGEPYEHVYVEFRNVTVVNREEWTTGRWNWSIKAANGLTLEIGDYSGYYRGDANTDSTLDNSAWQPPAEGTTLEYIRGVIVQNTRVGYSLAPLTPSDVGLGSVVPATITGVNYSPAIPSSDDDIMVSATITDDESVASAVVYYAIGINSTDWQSVDMNNTNGDDWEASIPKQTDGSYIKLYVEATDNQNNKSYGPDQTGLGTIVKVIDGGLRSIADIQMTPKADGASIYDDKTLEGIVLTAVVTGTVNYLGITTIQDGNDPNSGIFIRSQAGDGLSQVKRGDILTITKATVTEEFGVTHLSDLTFTKADGSELPSPLMNVAMDSFQNNASAEKYEGMFMEWTDVVVADTAPDFPSFFGEFAFSTDLQEETPRVRVDDLSPFIESNFAQDSLDLGQELAFIKGIMFYSFGNWKLLPRDKNDIAGYNTKYPESVNEINNQIELNVFPNPASNNLNISFKNESQNIAQLRVVDMTGKTIYSENVSDGQAQINISNLTPGVYYLRISTNSFVTAYPFTKN